MMPPVKCQLLQIHHRRVCNNCYVEMSNKKQTVSVDILNFLEKTSTRGLPRIIKANDSAVRSVWVMAVLLCLSLLLLHTSYLFQSYVKWDFTTADNEKPYNSELDHQVHTVCSYPYHFCVRCVRRAHYLCRCLSSRVCVRQFSVN